MEIPIEIIMDKVFISSFHFELPLLFILCKKLI
jgi:hypothetical protein